MFGLNNPAVSRRDMLRITAAGFASYCAAPWFNVLAARASRAASPSVSRFELGSSRTIRLGSPYTARARPMRWRYPPERIAPPSPT